MCYLISSCANSYFVFCSRCQKAGKKKKTFLFPPGNHNVFVRKSSRFINFYYSEISFSIFASSEDLHLSSFPYFWLMVSVTISISQSQVVSNKASLKQSLCKFFLWTYLEVAFSSINQNRLTSASDCSTFCLPNLLLDTRPKKKSQFFFCWFPEFRDSSTNAFRVNRGGKKNRKVKDLLAICQNGYAFSA